MQKGGKERKAQPKQEQEPPGKQASMKPQPATVRPHRDKRMEGKVALITGADSGIGRAVAVAFAQEGCDVAIAFLKEETEDAQGTKRLVEDQGCSCLLLPGDITRPAQCRKVVERTVHRFGKLDVLVNNAAMQKPREHFTDMTEEQLEHTFAVNVFAPFHLALAAVPKMKKGACIINTTSVTAYRGSAHLVDYSATKGALVSFTRSLSSALLEKGIRVNAVAPGPIWTPLIPSTFKPKDVAKFGTDAPMKRAGQPEEVAPSYVFLACEDSSYMTGQVLHPNGGEVVNG